MEDPIRFDNLISFRPPAELADLRILPAGQTIADYFLSLAPFSQGPTVEDAARKAAVGYTTVRDPHGLLVIHFTFKDGSSLTMPAYVEDVHWDSKFMYPESWHTAAG